MSISQGDVIDAIGVEVASGKLVLTISDHLGWEAEEDHLAQLRKKLNSYLRFVESGELLQEYPDAAGRAVVIDIVARVEASSGALTFLRNATETIRRAGLELRFRVLREKP